MKIIKSFKKAGDSLKSGELGIIPTDTIYGISCLASSKENIERIYEIKGRDYSKPFIILISKIGSLSKFGICLTENDKKILEKYWPGPVSVILKVEHENLAYLHRGKKSLAFRLPSNKNLISILNKTGPLVSTSANISDNPPISSLDEARKYFEQKLDFILDMGPLDDRKPSRIIEIKNGIESIIR